MKEVMRSGNVPGNGEKTRRPFGCLIIKKKDENMSSGCSVVKRKSFEAKERKRPRLILSDSESDNDEFRRNLIGSNVVGSSNGLDSFGHEKDGEIDRKKSKLEPVKFEKDSRIGKNRIGDVGIERKRIRVDGYELADDVQPEKKFVKKEWSDDRDTGIGRNGFFSSKSPVRSFKHRELEPGHSRSIAVFKREHSDSDRRKSFPVEHRREADYTGKQIMKMKDCSFRPVDRPRDTFGTTHGQPIRVQGKNGVLKVMINNRNKVGGSEKFYGSKAAEENRQFSRFADTSNWKTSPSTSLYLEDKSREKSRSVVVKEKKSHINSLKNLSDKHSKVRDGRKEISGVSLPKDSKNVDTCNSKEVKDKEEGNSTSETCVPAKRKEGEVRRGSGTKKQLLRDQIRKMLQDARWTIDFRPRRNRNYQDAVYISPSGTEYWSIVKAYNALQKHFEEEGSEGKHNGNTSSFTPIPEEVLSQLTRQTKKKIERDMKMKQKADGGSRNARIGSKKQVKNKHAESSLKVRIKGNASVGINTKDRDDRQKSTLPIETASNEDRESLRHEQGNSSGAWDEGTQKPTADKKPSIASDGNLFQGKKSKKHHGRALLVRGSNNGLNLDDNDDDDFVPYSGKRTVLSWLIDMETVPLSGKVQYMNKKRTQPMLEGWITRDGIHCGCCSKILTVSKFEIHAGSKLRRPFQNIILENGVSLLQCQLNAWNKLDKYVRDGLYSIDVNGDDPNDDTCGICGDGGDLICCDGCPSTFHQSCLGIQTLPQGDWLCPNCSCKYCHGVDGNTGQGKDITFSALCTCSLCEEKYHRLCSSHSDSVPNDSNSLCTSFCGQTCKELFQLLQKLLGVKHELEEGFSWTLIHCSDLDTDASTRALAQKAECNSKLAVALTIMDECFLPVVDRRSGINLIRNVLFNVGSNFNRLNYRGFYTAVLERGDEIISAASIRLHGTRLAEMPYIGTRHMYRRQGMCRRLLNAIESALCSLNVEKLVIPAISELMHTWTAVFGFKPLEESQRKEMRHLNMLVFPSTDMLEKPLLKHKLNEGDVTSCSDVRITELTSNSHVTPATANKSDTVPCLERDSLACDEGVVPASETNNESDSTSIGLLGPGGSTYNTFDLISNPLEAERGLEFHAPTEEYPPGAVPCAVDCDSKLEVDTEPISNSFVEPKNSSEDISKGPRKFNVVAGVELDHSFVGNSAQHTTITDSNNFQLTRSPKQTNSDLNQHNMHKVGSESVEVCHSVADATQIEEDVRLVPDKSSKQDASEVRSEVPAAAPDSDVDQADNSSNINTQHQDVTFQGSSENIPPNDTGGSTKPLSTVTEHNYRGSRETLEHLHDSRLLQENMESALEAIETLTGACGLENKTAAAPKMLGEDSVDCTAQVLGPSCMLLSREGSELEVGRACKDQAISCRNDDATGQRGN